MLSKSTLLRLETQLDVIPVLLRDAPPRIITAGTPRGEWSAHENLAHLARHHEIFLERLRRIMTEDAPELGRYRAEEDSSWSEWSSLTTDEVIRRLNNLRAEIIQFIRGLSEPEENRVGIHPLFGQMDLNGWIEFFLLHEAHHLYKLMLALGEAKRALVAK
ncbi:MAG TPA: DinB family protein [Blastocatellia bacterium]|nr:DinB family protein [Blastocatellia bacterium]